MLTARMVAALRCPVCEAGLTLPLPAARSLSCALGHSFDLARQGYVSLGTGRKLPEGDTAEMVEARAAFLGQGHFRPLEAELVSAAAGLNGLRVDLGAGTGHYLARLLDDSATAEGLALDVSKPALRRAAKAHPRLGVVQSDTWREIPLQSGSAGVLLNIFAPRNGAAMRRVLAEDGTLIVVTPEQDHLIELRTRAGLLKVDEAKSERLERTLSDFDLIDESRPSWRIGLSAEQAGLLIAMGPNAHHTSAQLTDEIEVTASVRVSRWRGRLLPSRPVARDMAR